MSPYARHIGNAWFLIPTIGLTEHAGGECMLALIWLQLEVGLRWMK